MQKASEEKHRFLSFIKGNYDNYMKHRSFEVKPQMPMKQVSYFIRQAVRKKYMITIQINPTPYNNRVSEATGMAHFSPYSSQVILTAQGKKTTYLINAETIRHIRLEKRN